MSTVPVLATRVTFDDEFTRFSNSPDGSSGTWMTSYPYGGEAARTLTGNREAEYYSDSSVGQNPFSLNGGVLTITASVAAPGSNPYNLPYDSGVITTDKSFSQTYGYFEANAKLPNQQGLWPAFWMLPASNQYTSELDVLEAVGNHPNTIYSTTHGATDNVWGAVSQAFTVADTSSFHTYGVDWEPTTTTFYFDGKAIGSAPTPASMNSPMFMLLNLAVGGPGSWPGKPDGTTKLPAGMQIDWVRAYATAGTTYVGGSAAIPAANSAAVAASIGVSIGTPTPTPAPAPSPAPSSNTVVGSGADSIVVSVSEDAWQGDAQFTISIDGKQIGGTQTATASHAKGNTQTFTFDGDWGTGAHKVAMTFINDAYGGTASTDRNLFINSVAYDGQSATPASVGMYSGGSTTFSTGATGPGTLTLLLAEDSYQGDAQYSVVVDGKAVGGTGTATAAAGSGQTQAVNLAGTLAAGWHTVAVSFLNDAYGGTGTTDRNLYIKGVDVNGTAAAGSAATLYSSGTHNFSVYVPSPG